MAWRGDHTHNKRMDEDMHAHTLVECLPPAVANT